MKQVALVQGITNTGQNTPRCYVGIKKPSTRVENRNLTTAAISFSRSISDSMEFKPESLSRSELGAKLGT